MNGCNLTVQKPMSKTVVRGLLLLAAAALLLSCSEDISLNTTEDVGYNGSYAAARIVEIIDDDTEYVYAGGNLRGLMFIQDSSYTLDVMYSVGQSIYGRSDSGTLSISEGFLYFNTVADTFLQSVPWGESFPERSEIKINYLKNGNLWTETWKRAVPVVPSDTSSNFIPY